MIFSTSPLHRYCDFIEKSYGELCQANLDREIFLQTVVQYLLPLQQLYYDLNLHQSAFEHPHTTDLFALSNREVIYSKFENFFGTFDKYKGLYSTQKNTQECLMSLSDDLIDIYSDVLDAVKHLEKEYESGMDYLKFFYMVHTKSHLSNAIVYIQMLCQKNK